jgi:hypothetical protein
MPAPAVRVKEPVAAPLVMVQAVTTVSVPPLAVMVQDAAAPEANPNPLTVNVLPLTVIGGETVIEGNTVKEVVPVSVVPP